MVLSNVFANTPVRTLSLAAALFMAADLSAQEQPPQNPAAGPGNAGAQAQPGAGRGAGQEGQPAQGRGRGGRGGAPAQPRPEKNAELFSVESKPLVDGLYQVGYSRKNDALFVTASAGRGGNSALLKVDPKSLEIVARAVPPKVEGSENVHGVYGVGVDDANETVWATNSRSNAVAVFKQSDLSVVKQFPSGSVGHGRDVVIDSKNGKAYVTGNTPNVMVIDTKTLEVLPAIDLKSEVPEGKFAPMSLDLDRESGKLYTVSMQTPEYAIIDTATGKVEKVGKIEGAARASGVAYDSANKRLIVANQGSTDALVIDPANGQVVHKVDVGMGGLNAAFEPVSKLTYVTVRGTGTISILNAATGEVVAVVDGGTNPNHITEDGKGNIFAVNKSQGQNDPKGNQIRRISPKAK